MRYLRLREAQSLWQGHTAHLGMNYRAAFLSLASGLSLPELELWKSECPPLTCPFAHLQDYFLPRNLLLEPAELSACPLDLRVLSCPMGMRTVLLPTEPGHTPGSGDAPRLRKAQADTEHPGRGCMHQVLGSISTLQTPGVALHTYNPRTRQED